MPLYLREADVRELLDMPSCIQALRQAFAAEAKGAANVVPRARWPFGGVRLNVMGGGEHGSRRFALKSYGAGVFHVLLYAEGEGLLAIIEADVLGQVRTGAASAVASEMMARPGAAKVALVGTGRQARTQVLALKAIGMLDTLVVAARSRAKLEAFCTRIADELGIPSRAATSIEEAAAGADIVVIATGSAEPVLKQAWLAPGAHVNAIGANAANRRELDDDCVLKASLVVTDHIEQAKIEAGEFIDLAKTGRFDWSTVRPLHQIVVGPRIPSDATSHTLFKSLGVGLEDVAAASVVYDRALASGRGTSL
ncbi:MAG: ornithine cyclodeaminase family protein [Hyphomicrobiales bacterium]|nr:ornithine cyclodeaminase family protein [Hyphomicrobiales bacterium]